jgi:hypothetical protein
MPLKAAAGTPFFAQAPRHRARFDNQAISVTWLSGLRETAKRRDMDWLELLHPNSAIRSAVDYLHLLVANDLL